MVSPHAAVKVFLVITACLAVNYCLWTYYHLVVYKRRSPYSLSDTTRLPMNQVNQTDVTTGAEVISLHFDTKRKYKYLILDYLGYQLNRTDFIIDNCLVSFNRHLIGTADAVAIATRKLNSVTDLPGVRHPWQRWVWVLDESPHHAISGQNFRLSDFDHVYNWTMTYSRNSDVHIPYGWVVRKDKPETEVRGLGKRDGLIASVISNCAPAFVHNHRMEYIVALNRTISLTLYGGCGKQCPGYELGQQASPCPDIKNFLFYLAFENSNCKEYITEKVAGNAFSMGAVPIVMGASKEEYAKVTPPNSFIHVKDFASPQKLGEYLLFLSKNATAYMRYQEWRKAYRTEYRVQFVHRTVWRPLCDKLNADNGKTKTIPSLEELWKKSDCDDAKFW